MITELRKTIAKNFCRSVLWIDDEIVPDAETEQQRQKYVDFFVKRADEFSKKGILCHLKGFSASISGADADGQDAYGEDSDNGVSECVELSKRADVLILDWHLGIPDNPKFAKEILDPLIEEKAARFIIILSQDSDLEKNFRKDYGHVFSKKGDWYSNSNGQFVRLLQKALFEEDGSARSLVEDIYDKLAETYPDYLHWTALEIAGKMKECAPVWLAALPKGTDLGILAEKIHNKEEYVGNTVVENLLEDLKEAIDFPLIGSMQQEKLTPESWLRFEEFKRKIETDVKALTDKKKSDSVEAIGIMIPRSNDHPPCPDKDLKKKCKKLEEALTEPGDLPAILEFLNGLYLFEEFCEIKSSASKNYTKIQRGTIIAYNSDKDSNEILVCISQSCDCVRETHLLFVKGKKSNASDAGKPGETFLRFKNKLYIFASGAENMLSLALEEGSRLPKDTNFQGIVRESILNRLISRYWNHATRVGVNQPLLLRRLRNEKP